MKIAIIGAGPAGITAAYQLAKENIQVDVFEASDSIGGMAKTINLWNQKVDLGPHRFFSSDPRVNEVWLELVGDDYDMVNRLTRIFYKNRFFYYPLKPLNALIQLGILEAVNCVFSFAKQSLTAKKKVATEESESFEDWVVKKFGRRLFEIFFKTYSEKLWGISCGELDADFAAQRIKKLSLIEALKAAFKGNKDNKHKTLVDTFAYPHEGSGMVYERMADFVRLNGGNIYLKTPVRKVCTETNEVTGLELMDGKFVEYDEIISTMPLTRLVSQLPEVPEKIVNAAKSLKFRNTILVYLKVEAVDLFPDNWLYIHADSLRTGRITNFRNWSSKLYGDEQNSILALEYWCYDEDKIWTSDDQDLIALASDEMRKTGLIGDATIADGFVHRVKNCYPVYNRGYKENLKPIEDYLGTVKNLSIIGRYGAFKYNNQDHSILMGILAASNISQGTRHNLWDINTDYEYQESAKIDETGLEKDISPTPEWSFANFSLQNQPSSVQNVSEQISLPRNANLPPLEYQENRTVQ
jgi:protoporphyrinogen oxidase